MSLADMLAVIPPNTQAPGQDQPGASLAPCVKDGFWTAWLLLIALHIAYLFKLLARKMKPVSESERCQRCGQPKWDCKCELDEEPW